MEGKISEQEIRARAYSILYGRYKSLFEQVTYHARNQTQHGTDSKKIDALRDIGDISKYVYIGFLEEGDLKLIKTLEYCLGERNSLD